MVSSTPSSDRQSHATSASGNAHIYGHNKADRPPGTPRKDGGLTKEKAVQDPGLKDYVCSGTRMKR